MSLSAMLALPLILGLPAAAHAEPDWGPRGLNGAKIYLSDDGYGSTSYAWGTGLLSVSGKGFVPSTAAQIFECQLTATDFRNQCLPLGTTQTDAVGNFPSTNVLVLKNFHVAGDPTSEVDCYGEFGAQCAIVAATADAITQQPSTTANHYICMDKGSLCRPKPPGDPESGPLNSAHGERLKLSRNTELGYNYDVIDASGTGFVASANAELFRCRALTRDVRNDCTRVGIAPTGASGNFGPQKIPIDGAGSGCAAYGAFQCSVVAATFAGPLDTDPTSRAEDFICIGGGAGPNCTPGDPTLPTTTTTEPIWQQAASMAQGREYPAAAAAPDGRIYALGGVGPDGHVLDSAEVTDSCRARTWAPIASMPSPRSAFAAVAGPNGLIYAIGGTDGDGLPTGRVDAYNPATNSWSPMASMAVPRSDLAAVVGPDGRIYAIGGMTGQGTITGISAIEGSIISRGHELPTVEAYDPPSDRWQTVTPLTYARAHPGVMNAPDGHVYVIGGAGTLGGTQPGVEYYTPGPVGGAGVWQTRDARRTIPNGAAMTWAPDGRIYSVGGGGFVTDVVRSVVAYDPVTDLWYSLTEGLTSHRTTAAAAPGRDGRIYAIGGLESTNDPNGLFPLASTEALQVGPNLCPRLTQPADFDGNFTTDISVFRPANGTWFVKDGASTGYGADGDVPIPADYDGDQKTDLAIFRPATGLWAIHRSSDNTDVFVTYGISTDVPIPADYDGDGRADIAVYRPEFATWWVHRSTDNVDVPTTFGIATDVPIPADYDGDGRADLAVFRDGTWFTLPSSGGAYVAANYGNPGDVPVPADYDADHSIDRAVFRPSTGEWFLHHSSDGTDENFAFGVGGDVPVPGDYNGDRTSDPGLFRPGTGQWFVETGETASWGISTDIPLPLPYAVRAAYFPS